MGNLIKFVQSLNQSCCLCSVYRTRRSQSDGVLLEVPHCASIYKSKKHFGHSFAYDAPRIWNDLPDDVRSAKSLSSFRKKLKTYLFEKAYPPQITLSFSICLLRCVDPCNVPDLTITISDIGFLRLRVYHQIEIKRCKSIIRIRMKRLTVHCVMEIKRYKS